MLQLPGCATLHQRRLDPAWPPARCCHAHPIRAFHCRYPSGRGSSNHYRRLRRNHAAYRSPVRRVELPLQSNGRRRPSPGRTPIRIAVGLSRPAFLLTPPLRRDTRSETRKGRCMRHLPMPRPPDPATRPHGGDEIKRQAIAKFIIRLAQRDDSGQHSVGGSKRSRAAAACATSHLTCPITSFVCLPRWHPQGGLRPGRPSIQLPRLPPPAPTPPESVCGPLPLNG
jgi:hypothetical protein